MNNKCRSILKELKNFWKNADAQDLVEYALLLLMIALALGATLKSFTSSIKSAFAQGALVLAEAPGNAGTGASVSAALSSNANIDSEAAAVNAAAAAADAAAAAQASNFVAAADLNGAALALSNIGITLGAFGAIGGAAFDDAQAALAAAAGNTALANLDATRANADVVAAAQDVANATSKGTILGL